MQRALQGFIRDFRNGTKKSRYRDYIVSVILFGSAARESFVLGQSDVDIIVVAKDEKHTAKIQRFMRDLIKRLNKKHKLLLETTCSDERKFKNSALNAVLGLESFFLYGVPVYVLSQDKFDIVKRRVCDAKLWFLLTFVGSLSEFLKSIKQTGKVVYGKNLIKGITAVKFGVFDQIKMMLQPYYLLVLGLAVLPFDPKLALKHAIKASFLESEFDLMLLHKHLKSYRKDEMAYERSFNHYKFNVNHMKKTFTLRERFNTLKITRPECISYMIRSCAFVATTHIALYLNKTQFTR